MKPFLKFFSVLLLLFNGIGAVYGGYNLVTKPDGSSMQMPLTFLQHSPFQDYFIPGVLLFIANGLFSLFVCLAVLLNLKNYSWLVMIQGAILIGWIQIQILMIKTIVHLHIIMGLTGFLLLLCGWMLHRINSEHIKHPSITH